MNEALYDWMVENGYTNSSLAKELGWSYEYIYKIVNQKSPVSEAFKWRFAQRFSIDVANRIFVPAPALDSTRLPA